MALGFLHQLYDWAEFERFVSELYSEDSDVVVERNVIDVDRFGARRETDVKVTRRTKFHTYVTLIECKRWKEPVSRDRIDVLAASVDALGAQKGAVFTTTGFEEGAKAYATGKGIDLFVVRELNDEEWGSPGRKVQLYLHFWSAEFSEMLFPESTMIPLIDHPPTSLNLKIEVSADQVISTTYDLHSVVTGNRGPNLVSLLLDTHGRLLNHLAESVKSVLPGGSDASLGVLVRGVLDFSDTEYKQIRLPQGAVRFHHMPFTLVARLDQKDFRFDKAANTDIALAIENYVGDRRFVAHRKKGDEQIRVLGLRASEPHDPNDPPVTNGSIVKMVMVPWVLPEKSPVTHNGVLNGVAVLRILTDSQGKPTLELSFHDRPMPGNP